MNKILVIDDNNELNLPSDLDVYAISSDSDELYTEKLSACGLIIINRNVNSLGIIQLIHIINKIPHFIDTPIIVVTDWIRNYERLELSTCSISKYISKTELNIKIIDELYKTTNVDFLEETIVDKTALMNKLVFSHNSNENMINSYLLEAALNITSVKQTVKSFFNTLNTLNPNDIIVIILKEGKVTKSYTWISDSIKKPCFDDFIKFCLHNHHDNFSGVNIEGIEHHNINNISEDIYNSMDIDNKRISSYYYSPIYNPLGEPIGTIHIGNFINNYFNNSGLREKLTELFYRIGELINNSIEYQLASDSRKNTFTIFSKFIPEGVINKLLKEGEIDRTGEVKRICVLFSDIRSFTTISERNSAEDVVRLLNNYFNIMVKCIRDQGGTIDKFIGDAIMAIFGAPDNIKDQEIKAITAAKNMIESLKKVDTKGITLPSMGFKIGIGIDVGDSIVGNIGSKEKKTYTSIGNTATIAEELEGLTKKYNKPILISGDMSQFCISKEVDKIDIEGKQINIFSVEGIK